MTNYTIQEEVIGFKAAVEFFNQSSRLNMSKQMVLSIAEKVRKDTSNGINSVYGMGFYDASVIIARTRESNQ